MRYIESPNVYKPKPGEKTIFLAGSISGCSDWQQEMVHLLSDTDLVLFNPRRKYFPIDDPNAKFEQISWEYKYLCETDAILFWFSPETLCPIVLYELGAWSMTDKPIYLGVHPSYQRKQDVALQTKLIRPNVRIVHSIVDLATQIKG